jgi:membrane protein required for colicin V production
MNGIFLNFNELDLAILGIIFLSGLFAYIRGFSWEIINLFSWILTLAAVWYLSWTAGPWVGALIVSYLGWSLPYFVVVGIAGIIVFLGMTLLLGPMTGFIMKGSLNMQMGFMDRFLGFIYGAARGLLLIIGIFFVYAWFVPEENYYGIVKDAQFFLILKDLSQFIQSIFTNG